MVFVDGSGRPARVHLVGRRTLPADVTGLVYAPAGTGSARQSLSICRIIGG